MGASAESTAKEAKVGRAVTSESLPPAHLWRSRCANHRLFFQLAAQSGDLLLMHLIHIDLHRPTKGGDWRDFFFLLLDGKMSFYFFSRGLSVTETLLFNPVSYLCSFLPGSSKHCRCMKSQAANAVTVLSHVFTTAGTCSSHAAL